jgi:hypothetical protein
MSRLRNDPLIIATFGVIAFEIADALILHWLAVHARPAHLII